MNEYVEVKNKVYTAFLFMDQNKIIKIKHFKLLSENNNSQLE